MLLIILQDIVIQDPLFKWNFDDYQKKIRNIDDTSWKILSKTRAHICTLQLVPNVQV